MFAGKLSLATGGDESKTHADPASALPEATRVSKSDSPINFDELVERCLGNMALVERALRRFQSTFEDDLDALDDSGRSGRWSTVAKLAHKMRGTCANISALDLARLMEQIERVGEAAKQPGEVRFCLEAARNEYARACSFIASRAWSTNNCV